MKATLLTRARVAYSETAFAEVVVWQLPRPMPGSNHLYKYRMALVVHGVCVLRYDNEAGKGDHRHLGRIETRYRFTSIDKLFKDFERDTRSALHEDRHP